MRFRIVAVGLAAFVISLTIGVAVRRYDAWAATKPHRDARQVHQQVEMFWHLRDMARRAEPKEAVALLYQLQGPSPRKPLAPTGWRKSLNDVVDEERRSAALEVINSLREKTHLDLGNEPKPWILKYGDDDLVRTELEAY